MIQIIFVGVGSFVGGVLRYALSTWVHSLLENPWFPYGTLAVNTLGCLVIGLLAGLAESKAGLRLPRRHDFFFSSESLADSRRFPLLLWRLSY